MISNISKEALIKRRLEQAGKMLSPAPSRIGLNILPQELFLRTDLTELEQSGKRLTTLPSKICQLINLIKIDLSHNLLTTLPSEIGKLTKLTELDLSHNRLTTLPSEIGQLTSLTYLDLNDNQLTNLPQTLLYLTNLQYLYLRENKFTTLPPELFRMTKLTALGLAGLNLTVLPPEIGQLTNLTQLHLQGNRLSTMPLEVGHLSKLKNILLSDNHITVLPSEIGQLTNLTRLDLDRNQLTALPSEIGKLTKLTELNLSYNQLTTLPLEICKLTKLEKLQLDGNPITSPPLEIAKQGIGAIRRYFAELEKSKHPLNEVKILLIGDGAAGKTSLVKRLVDNVFNQHEDTTVGVNIRDWKQKVDKQEIKINLWDFGGQVIQHATHQFFLSKRSLYVLVLNGRKDEQAEYWLRYIEAFGGGSPVLIVLNKHDENPSFDVNRPFLREKYPGIKDFCRISCKTDYGIAKFKERLLEELGKVEMISTVWPGSWFKVKRKLEDMDKPYISAEDYKKYCAEAGIAEEESCETLVDFLHDLGVAVHFRDFILDAMHVLDPIWVTEAVYKIVTAEEMAESGGVLRLECLKELLKELPPPRLDRLRTMLRLRCAKRYCFPPETHSYIMHLMEKFELCYPIGKDEVLIPQLLPVTEPKIAFNKKDSLRFALHYPDFLPPSVFPRFMVKVHKDIHNDTRWRTGVLLKEQRSEAQALVKADVEARRINLWVQGERPRDYLHYLRYLLADINSNFEKLTVSERVPMPDDPQRTADYETLRKCADRGIGRYMPEGSDKDYSVHQLLGLVQPRDKDELVLLGEKMSKKEEDKATWVEMFNDLFTLNPSLFGITFNLHGFFKELLAREKQKRNKKR